MGMLELRDESNNLIFDSALHKIIRHRATIRIRKADFIRVGSTAFYTYSVSWLRASEHYISNSYFFASDGYILLYIPMLSDPSAGINDWHNLEVFTV